ncbi:MAG: hypothetical protein PVF15_04905 [Candidatus Bathyarchaeota archaeon]|jgi:hypothetical protein
MSGSLERTRNKLQEHARKLGRYWSEWNNLHPVRSQPAKRKRELQRIVGLTDSEFQRLKSAMPKQQFEFFIESVLKRQSPLENLTSPIQEEKKLISHTQKLDFRNRMQVKGWR